MTRFFLIEEFDDMDGYYGAYITHVVCSTEKRAEKWLEDHANKEMEHCIDSEEWYKKNVPVCLNPEYHIRDFSIREIELIE